jgi:hypothetical protein
MRFTTRFLLASALAFVLVTAYLPARAAIPQPVTPEAVAKQLATKMQQRFEVQGLRIEVVPFDDDAQTQQGHFQSIALQAEAAIIEGVSVRDFFVRCDDVTLDLEKLFADKIEVCRLAPGKCTVSGKLLEADLNKVLQQDSRWARESGLKDMRVQLLEGAVKFTAKAKQLLGAQVEMIGTLDVRDHSKIELTPTATQINGVPIPVGLVKGLLKKLNPICDFAGVPMQPTLEKVTVTPEYILVQG